MEKSSVVPDAALTTITKTQATTKLLLLDGEEAAIGGLFVNDNTTIRRGVPFLKDLPWWVLGLRYIFGYDEVTTTTQEVIVLVKVNILPTLKERIELKKEDAALMKEWKENRDEIDKYSEQIKKAQAERKKESEQDDK